jgi:hypothetical protein
MYSAVPQPLPKRAVSTECHLVLRVQISSILSFPQGHQVAAYLIFLVFPSFLSFPLFFDNVFQKAVPTEGVTNSVQHPLSSLRPSSSCLPHLPRLPVISSL